VRAGDLAPALGRGDVGAEAQQRMRDLVAQTEAFVRNPAGSLPHYPSFRPRLQRHMENVRRNGFEQIEATDHREINKDVTIRKRNALEKVKGVRDFKVRPAPGGTPSNPRTGHSVDSTGGR
jgi:hypothetical protein